LDARWLGWWVFAETDNGSQSDTERLWPGVALVACAASSVRTGHAITRIIVIALLKLLSYVMAWGEFAGIGCSQVGWRVFVEVATQLAEWYRGAFARSRFSPCAVSFARTGHAITRIVVITNRCSCPPGCSLLSGNAIR
jgi:hypothetical protein